MLFYWPVGEPGASRCGMCPRSRLGGSVPDRRPRTGSALRPRTLPGSLPPGGVAAPLFNASATAPGMRLEIRKFWCGIGEVYFARRRHPNPAQGLRFCEPEDRHRRVPKRETLARSDRRAAGSQEGDGYGTGVPRGPGLDQPGGTGTSQKARRRPAGSASSWRMVAGRIGIVFCDEARGFAGGFSPGASRRAAPLPGVVYRLKC